MPRTEKLSISGNCMRDVLLEMTYLTLCKIDSNEWKDNAFCHRKAERVLQQINGQRRFRTWLMQVAKWLAEYFQNALAPVKQKLDSMGTKIKRKYEQRYKWSSKDCHKDVISSSKLIIIASQDSEVRRVYFNHDLTRLLSEELAGWPNALLSRRTQKDTTTTQPFP